MFLKQFSMKVMKYLSDNFILTKMMFVSKDTSCNLRVKHGYVKAKYEVCIGSGFQQERSEMSDKPAA